MIITTICSLQSHLPVLFLLKLQQDLILYFVGWPIELVAGETWKFVIDQNLYSSSGFSSVSLRLFVR